MMDWNKVATTIGSTAPLLAGLVGGPIGLGVTAASTIISHVLGTANDPQSISAALEDPAALEKVKQAENANSIQLQQLSVTAAQAQLTQSLEMARVQAGDRANARSMGTSTRDWVPKVLAMAVTAGFFGILLLMTLRTLPEDNRDLVNVILGSLGTAWISIIGYYFGTSAGSARKTELLSKPSVPILPDSALTLRENVPGASASKQVDAGDLSHHANPDMPSAGAQGASYSPLGAM